MIVIPTSRSELELSLKLTILLVLSVGGRGGGCVFVTICRIFFPFILLKLSVYFTPVSDYAAASLPRVHLSVSSFYTLIPNTCQTLALEM